MRQQPFPRRFLRTVNKEVEKLPTKTLSGGASEIRFGPQLSPSPLRLAPLATRLSRELVGLLNGHPQRAGEFMLYNISGDQREVSLFCRILSNLGSAIRYLNGGLVYE